MTTQRKIIGNEQFFTGFETAARLSRFIKSQDWFSNVTRIIEPSAGDGAWLRELDVDIALDIEPMHPDVERGDYFEQDIPYQEGTLIVGNPPFGRMGNLAVRFFNRAATQGDWIAFIVPASFGKVTLRRRLDKFFHLAHQEDLLDERFRFERDGKVVKCVFQIWERREYERVDSAPRRTTADFAFRKVVSPSSGAAAPAPLDADMAIRTHGHGYGSVTMRNDPKWQCLNTRTHRFICSNIDIQDLATRLKAIDWTHVGKYTVGQPCISTEEIVEQYEQAWPANSLKA